MKLDPKELLRIDKDNLDEEFTKQALNYYQVHELYAQCGKEMDFLAQRISISEADEASDFRKDQLKAGGKATALAIEHHLAHQPALMEMRREQIELKNKRETLQGLLRGLEHKKECLKSFAYSYGRNTIM